MNQLQSFRDQVARTEEIISSKEESKNDNAKGKTQSEEDKEADQTFLDELVKECEKKAKAFDQRSKSRSNEMMALAEALEILKGKVSQTYGANKKLNLLSTSASEDEVSKLANAEGHWKWVPAISFLQVDGIDAASRKAVEYLLKKSDDLQSPTLSTLVLKIKGDHFKKVRDMIKDLVAKLEADAASEETQKTWCDEQMKDATEKRDESIGDMEEDMAKLSEANAKITKLTEEIDTLSVELADHHQALADATDMRKAEKSQNEKTLVDAKAGLVAIKS